MFHWRLATFTEEDRHRTLSQRPKPSFYPQTKGHSTPSGQSPHGSQNPKTGKIEWYSNWRPRDEYKHEQCHFCQLHGPIQWNCPNIPVLTARKLVDIHQAGVPETLPNIMDETFKLDKSNFILTFKISKIEITRKQLNLLLFHNQTHRPQPEVEEDLPLICRWIPALTNKTVLNHPDLAHPLLIMKIPMTSTPTFGMVIMTTNSMKTQNIDWNFEEFQSRKEIMLWSMSLHVIYGAISIILVRYLTIHFYCSL